MESLDNLPLPHDDEMERALLGSIFLEESIFDSILNILKPQDFFNPRHKIIYEYLIKYNDEAEVLDPNLFVDYLDKHSVLDKVGGKSYINLIIADATPPSTALSMANSLKEKALIRELVLTANEIIQKAKTTKNINILLEEVESSIFKIAETRQISSYYSIGEVLKETLNIINELAKKEHVVTGLPTGFYDLDRLTTGFHKGDLVIVAARPGMGKTSFALSILYHISMIENRPSAFFSLEMSKEQIAMRLLCEDTRIPLKKIRSGFLNSDELALIADSAIKMMKAPLFIDDTASLKMLDLKAKARKLKKEKEIEVIVIDYLQLLTTDGKRENRQQEVAEISRGLKALAKELNIPIIALAQLSRQAEMRADKRPQLADLRESGSIEQDADTVIFIHRPEYYKKNPAPQEEGIAEIIIAKQRNGPTGTINLAFVKEITKFENLAQNYDNIDTFVEEEEELEYLGEDNVDT